MWCILFPGPLVHGAARGVGDTARLKVGCPEDSVVFAVRTAQCDLGVSTCPWEDLSPCKIVTVVFMSLSSKMSFLVLVIKAFCKRKEQMCVYVKGRRRALSWLTLSCSHSGRVLRRVRGVLFLGRYFLPTKVCLSRKLHSGMDTPPPPYPEQCCNYCAKHLLLSGIFS